MNVPYYPENDKMFGVGMAFAAGHLRNVRHNQCRALVNEFEEMTRMVKNINVLSDWVDVSEVTKESFDYPTVL